MPIILIVICSVVLILLLTGVYVFIVACVRTKELPWLEKEQLILSEYPDTTGVKKYHFPWRNRILAALGDCVVVTQAALKSGTMATVNEALELGKEVWCFPYPYNEEAGKGCNLLISQGANILYDEDILKNLRPLRPI